MRPLYLTVTTFFLCVSLCAQEHGLFHLYGTKLVNDSAYVVLTADHSLAKTEDALFSFTSFLEKKEAGKQVLHFTKGGRPVEAYFFPGTSEKKALVIGGLHGSELSSIEVAHRLIDQLTGGEKPFYNVVVIPSLFPDNAQAAKGDKNDRVLNNTGRYSTETSADPNRQMPLPGRPFTAELPYDAVSREIEEENRVVLQLIQALRPERLISVHAIKDRNKAGVFADPRTDCLGNALGFETDEALALLMARHIQAYGGVCPGNNLDVSPTAVYHLDPPVVSAGQKQMRSYQVSNLHGRGKGISFGTWCSTAVCDSDPERSRPAIRTFTMEFPGYLLSSEYKTPDEQERVAKLVDVYAASIRQYFLQAFFVEETKTDEGFRYASN